MAALPVEEGREIPGDPRGFPDPVPQAQSGDGTQPGLRCEGTAEGLEGNLIVTLRAMGGFSEESGQILPLLFLKKIKSCGL